MNTRARDLFGRVSLVGVGLVVFAVRGLGAQEAARREPMNTEARLIDGVGVLFRDNVIAVRVCRRPWYRAQVVPRKEFVAGYTFWLLKDYKQRMTYNHEYNGISTMGLVDFHGNRKLVYEAFRDAVNPAP